MEEKLKLVEAESVKKFAFFGVAVSTVATLTAIVAVPMLCMYMQNVQSGLQDEINFCRTRAQGLRGEYTKVSIVSLFVCLFVYTTFILILYHYPHILLDRVFPQG